MRNIFALRIIGLPFIFWAQPYSTAQASPSAETNWLMEEPSSLFDMGMYRTGITVENALNKFKTKINKKVGDELIYNASSYVEYDWNNDKIKIKWHIYYRINTLVPWKDKKEAINTQEKLNKLCLSSLSSLEGNTFGQSDSWEYYGKEQISEHFGHFGYSRTDMPKKLYRNFVSKITYEVLVQHDTFMKLKGESNKKLRPMLCKIGYNNPLKTSTPMYIDYWKELDRKMEEDSKKEAK